jgi:membrane protein YqaA with SNARE-associated domain
MAYLILFLTSLAAATIIPAQSEAMLTGLLLWKEYDPILLLLVATVGNVLGAVINWMLGRAIEHYKHRRWFPFKEAQLESAVAWYQRYGRWSLLLSWVPIIGDPITVVAGILREKLFVFLLLVTLAKATRYLVIAAIVLNW